MRAETLSIDVDGATWKSASEFDQIADYITWPSEDQVDTRSGRFHLQRHQKKVMLCEPFTGKVIDDPWLRSAYASYRDIDGLQNVETWLTDDLKYLICNPASIWNEGFGQKIHETFDLGGKTYRRAEYGIVWTRPAAAATVFKKQASDRIGLFKGPTAAFTIRGELYFFYRDKVRLRLVPSGAGKAFETKPPTDPEWEWVMPQTIQHDEANHRIVMFASDLLTKNQPEETTIVYEWDYQSGALTRADAKAPELFERQKTKYVPRRVAGVK
jgi:hypothetical protein